MNSYNNNTSSQNKDNPQFIFLEKIKAMLITILEKERINNSFKISLSRIPSLNLQKFFFEIDTNNKTFININDLKKFFNIYSISYTEQSLRKFIHLFDKHNKFYLIFDDFSKIFSPYESNNGNYNYFLNNEKDLIINILKGYLELIEQINEMIIDIRKTNNFTTYEAFMGITKGNKYLDEEFLDHFLEHNYNSEEIKNLIYLFDINNDKLISYDEFQEFFIPLLEYNNNLIIDNDDYNNKINIENNNDIVNYEKSGNKIKIINELINSNNNNSNINNENINIEKDNINNNIEIKENLEDNINIINNEENNCENINNREENNLFKSNNNNISKEDNEEKDALYEKNDINNYENIISNEDDYDNYCKFYRKTKQVLTSTRDNQIKNNNNKPNLNESKEKNSKNKDELNIIHSEIQYLPEQNNKNFNTAEKEKNLTNINNFTCGKKTQSEMDNSSSKKINLNINSNDLENYSLSNEYNNINNNINITSKDTNNKNIFSDDNIIKSSKENKSINANMNISEENNQILSSDKEIVSNNKITEKEENIDTNKSLSSFIKYVQYLLQKEKFILDLKDKLSLREDIALKDLFCIFDYNKRNCISKKEFKVVCKKIFGLYPTSDQVNLVFKRYDKDKDENLNLKEFLYMIKPLKEEYACFLFNKNKNQGNNNINKNINTQSKKIFNDVIKTIIENEGYYYKFKDDLDNNDLFDLNEFWETFVKYSNNDKGIDKVEFDKFLNDNACCLSLSQYDIDIIFNKIDFDKDDIISYDDLSQEFVNYY